MRLKNTVLFLFTSLLIIQISGCVDLPDEFVAPRYDLTLNMPLIDTVYSLDDALGDDSTLVASTDPASLGLLSYTQENTIETFYVEDNLTLSGFSTSTSQVVGSVKINEVAPIGLGIRVEDWTSDVSSGSQTIFPENLGEVTIGFSKIEQFRSVTLESGSLGIQIINRLPVDIEIRGLIISNAVGGDEVASKPETPPISIAALDSTTFSFDLGGKTIEDSLTYYGKIYSAGSNGQLVDIPADAGTHIEASFSNLAISSVVAPLPDQDPFSIDNTVQIDDSTYIEETIFDSGDFAITFNNNIDVAIDLNFSIANLRKPDGSSYSESFTLQRKELNKVISVASLSDWKITGLTPGTLTNELTYSATVQPLSASDPRTLSKTDSVGIEIQFGNSVLRSVKGKMKPVNFDIAETSFDFDLGDVKSALTYDQLMLNNPGIILNLSSSSQIDFELNGIIRASNGTVTKDLALNNVQINSLGTNNIDLRDYGLADFMNSFSTSLPNEFLFSGSAVVNPNYAVGTVTKDDSISGGISIEIPLDVGIAGGTYVDTTLNESDSDPVEGIQNAKLFIEIDNMIPVGLSFSGKVYDQNMNFLFNLPPDYNTSPNISINAPTVDTDGYSSTPGTIKQTFELRADEAIALQKTTNIVVKLELATAANSGTTPVKFRTSDDIRLKVYGELTYRVNN